jgi:hypothetical protein
VTGRGGSRLYDLEEKRGYCKLNEEALDRAVWRTGFGKGFGKGFGLVRQTAECTTDHSQLRTVLFWIVTQRVMSPSTSRRKHEITHNVVNQSTR